MIPRPETEFWVEKAIKEIKETQTKNDGHPMSIIRVLDLCAGSGAIGVAVANAIPEARVDFVELDVAHHPTIKANLASNQLDVSQYRLFGGDLFAEIAAETNIPQYDFILSNPPYIDPELGRAEVNVKKYEPALALYGGESGLELITHIIKEAPQYLQPKGQLWLEHEPEQGEAIEEVARGAGFTSAACYRDQYGVARYSVLKSY